MYRIYLVLFLLFFSQYSSFSQDAGDFNESLRGIFFTVREELPEGFSMSSVYVYERFKKNGFVLSRISYNHSRKWEELRYEGDIFYSPQSKNYLLQPTKCTLHGKSEIGKRFALLRTFDCEHVKFQIEYISNSKIRLVPDMFLESMSIYHRVIQDEKKSKVPEKYKYLSRIIDKQKKQVIAWSYLMKRIPKQAKVYAIKNKTNEKIRIEILENFESTGKYIDKKNQIEIDDYLIYEE